MRLLFSVMGSEREIAYETSTYREQAYAELKV